MTIARAQMNRQLYQMGGPIQEAESFYTNNLGMAPQEARSVLSNALNSYSQSMQPQSMMQMASNGGRIGYQMGGGIESMPMNFGQPLQVPPMGNPSFSPMQSMPSSPMLNYGQTPLTMNRGGIARLGYQMGGEAMMQPQGMQQEQGMGQLGEGDNALLTIIQLLIEQGVDPETAEKLARQILQIFAQGGEPALDQFISQLEQQEQTEEMASGGIAGYAKRQGYGFGSFFKGVTKAVSGVVKGVASAVKSVAKSPIGKIALTVAAGYFLGPAGGMFGGAGLGASLSTNAFLAGAINAGAANLLVQGITTGKFNPKEALLAGALGGIGGYMSPGTVGIDPNTGQAITSNASNITSNFTSDMTASPVSSTSTAQVLSPVDAYGSSTAQQISSNINASNPLNTYGSSSALENVGAQGMPNVGPITQTAKAYTDPTIMNRISQFGDTAKTGITNLYQDPLGTIQRAAGSAFNYATDPENTGTIATVGGLSGLALLGSQLGVPRNEGEDDMSYEKRLQEAQGYITQYGRNLKITNPYFYQREGAVNPFAPTMVAMAAQGGIMGYGKGGSMVPPARQIEGGIIELDARKTGGYIPYGKKERVDDVPAMLAKDEFVFTSRAVKAAGGGSAKRGAAKMYALMKQLEGARA